jgi:hypothetical protein
VKDAARAKKIISVLARVLDDDGSWVETDKNGVHYVSMPYSTGLFAFRPTLAVSDRFMVAGVDASSVEAAMQRSASRSSELANSETYKRAARTVPDPTNGFAIWTSASLHPPGCDPTPNAFDERQPSYRRW